MVGMAKLTAVWGSLSGRGRKTKETEHCMTQLRHYTLGRRTEVSEQWSKETVWA